MSHSPRNAILVLGGGLRKDGTLPPWVQNRMDRARQLHTGQPIILLSGGTSHKPMVRDAEGFPLFESVAGANYLMGQGIDPACLFTETSSFDTIGNAYFARVIHVDPIGIRNLTIVTSEFHMQRSQAIFEWIFGVDLPTDDSYQLTFESVTNVGLSEETLTARLAKEAAAAEHIQRLAESHRSLQAIHRWLFSHHDVYAAGKQPSRVSGPDRDSY